MTVYHAKYFAHELTKRCASDSVEKLATALSNAQVDLNPHQIEAALFAFRSPLSKGAILADEVGLGKTIEAGILLAQKWAERKRRMLVICPANLRKQWSQELADKFFPALRHSGDPDIQRGDPRREPESVSMRQLPSSAPTSSRGPRSLTSGKPPGIWWSSTKRTGFATSTSPPTRSPSDQAGHRPVSEGASDRHAAAELPS